jgi:nitrite reductase/ring-hydroxylating ferredoxin subunit
MPAEHGNEPTGSAYDLPPATYDSDLALVGKGTPGGELLRRYWHPIELSETVKDIPVPVRALGEDLILFRTPQGKLGLVHNRCCHRGTTLLYGKVEERGIRCCYHGWLFATDGTCLEQPCEPGGGHKLHLYRQPWYPVEERYGLVFAYLGPLAEKPPLPRYDILENIPDNMYIYADGDSAGSGGPHAMPCNWLQTHENAVDPFHVFVLHSTFSTAQFGELMRIPPQISWEPTSTGMIAIQKRDLPDGATMRRVVEMIFPMARIVPDPTLRYLGATNNVAWTLPLDDTNTRIFVAVAIRKGRPGPKFNLMPIYNGKTWFELDEEGHRRLPGDYEAQVGQGTITLHSEEHLVTSDRGVTMLRRMYRQGMAALRDGKTPMNLPGPADATFKVQAGNYRIEAASAAE